MRAVERALLGAAELAGSIGLEASGYDRLKLRVWAFVDSFANDGKGGFGRGDARAYVSALADVAAAERGMDYLSALSEAVGRAESIRRAAGAEGVREDARLAFKRYSELDRRKLGRHLLPRVGARPRLQRATGDWRPTVVSLFTGAYGLDLGFELAGFEVSVALDVSEDSYLNLKANRPKIPFILDDIGRLSTQDILKEAGLQPGEVDVVTGGPPCQPFSTAGKRRSLGDPRAAPIVDFVRVVKEARPKVFVMEEVPGLLSARIRHVPIRERGARPPSPEEEPGSAWRVVLGLLESTGYRVSWAVLNAADFGAPQVRERVIVVGVRPDLKRDFAFPAPAYGRRRSLTVARPWLTLLEAAADAGEPDHCAPLPPKYGRFMRYVPPGGNWRQIPDDLKPEAMGGAYAAGGGRMGFYRRLAWFEPSPTLVTSPAMKATMMVHPWEDRPLSVREYLRLQGFPDDWRVAVGASAAYRLFGEAVPVPLSHSVALAVYGILTG